MLVQVDLEDLKVVVAAAEDPPAPGGYCIVCSQDIQSGDDHEDGCQVMMLAVAMEG